MDRDKEGPRSENQGVDDVWYFAFVLKQNSGGRSASSGQASHAF